MANSNRISWIDHRGQKILFGDYSKLVGKDMIEVLRASEEVFRKLSSPVPILVDFTDSRPNTEFMDEIKEFGRRYDALISRSASVGIVGLKKIMATTYNTVTGSGHKSKYFDDAESALQWLSS